jgi:hypothetical protein
MRSRFLSSATVAGLLAMACATVTAACSDNHGSPDRSASPSSQATTSATTTAASSLPVPFAVFSSPGYRAECPSWAATGGKCYAISGIAEVAGLGHVSEQWVLDQAQTGSSCFHFYARGKWTVTGKGDLDFTALTADCRVSLNVICEVDLDYVFTGGSGPYRTASGRGTLNWGNCQGPSKSSWYGSLSALPRH